MLTTYSIDNKALELKSQHPYLGVIFHQSMSWSHHIDHLCGKATKSLNFLKRNISKCSKEVKITAYLTSIRPLLEYASCVWDPHQLYLINTLEKVQRRAARWVASDYNPMSSVTYLLDQLHWKSLQSRRCIDRLNLLYRVLHHALPSIQLPEYFKPTSYPTRLHHQYRYIIPPTSYLQNYWFRRRQFYGTERNGTEWWTKPRNGTLSQIEACNLPLLKLPLQVISGTSSGSLNIG